MSDQETETSPQIDSETPEDPLEGTDTNDVDKSAQGLVEARDRYREQRDGARGERDALAARLADLQTRELHRLAGEFLAAPEDIELSGKSLTDFTTPEGWVDRDAVKAAANAVIASRPGLAKHSRPVDRSQGLGTPVESPAPTWASVLKP